MASLSSSSLPPLHSHRTFGEFICSDPELLLFRRFNGLNARALRYMQSELLCLESKLGQFDEEDESDDSNHAMMSAVCFEAILARASEDNPREVERLELIRRIQELTHRYNTMLIAQKQVQDMASPNRRIWEVFSSWFRQNKPFFGKSGQLIQEKTADNFVAVGVAGDYDVLTSFVENIIGCVVAYTKRNTIREDAPAYYSHQKVQRLVTSMGIIGATVLLEAAIVALYLVTDDRVKFALVAVFISLFAVAISFLSNARRSEMFAATAAYAAVLVVFVSRDLGSGGSKTC